MIMQRTIKVAIGLHIVYIINFISPNVVASVKYLVCREDRQTETDNYRHSQENKRTCKRDN